MAVKSKYHIQLKRTKLPYTSDTIQQYPIVFGEPVYLSNENRFVLGPPSDSSQGTLIPNSPAVKLVSQNLQDPDDSSININLSENGVYFKNRNSSTNVVDLTDNEANKIYPKTKLGAVVDDDGVQLSEILAKKVNVDLQSITYTSLGYDSTGVFVDQFTPETTGYEQSLLDIINKKVSVDEGSVVQYDLSLGQDLFGVYVRVNDETVDEMNYVKSYIDLMLDDSINNRLSTMESSILLLQQQISSISGLYVGNEPPADTNRMWLDTTAVTGGLKYCYDKNNNLWSHIPVAYT